MQNILPVLCFVAGFVFAGAIGIAIAITVGIVYLLKWFSKLITDICEEIGQVNEETKLLKDDKVGLIANDNKV